MSPRGTITTSSNSTLTLGAPPEPGAGDRSDEAAREGAGAGTAAGAAVVGGGVERVGALVQPPRTVPAAITNRTARRASRGRIATASIGACVKETFMKRLVPFVLTALLCIPSFAAAQTPA